MTVFSEIFAVAKLLLDFVAAIAWPTVVLLVIYIFRSQVGLLWGRLASFDVGGVRITFAQELDRVEQAVRAEEGLRGHAPAIQIEAVTPITPVERFQRLLEISPAAAILDKWLEVDNAIRRLAEDRQLDVKVGQPMALIRALRQDGIVSDRVANILDELRALRNLAAHPSGRSREISGEEAQRFGQVSDEVLRLLWRK